MRSGRDSEEGGTGAVPPATAGKWPQLGLLALAETLAMGFAMLRLRRLPEALRMASGRR